MDLLKNFFKGDKAIWIIYLFLCLISIVEVFSASSTLTYKSGDHWGPITNHLTLLMVGTIAVWIVHNIPCRWFKTFIALLPISWGLLIAVFVIGALTNGAKRWIDLGFIQFQPQKSQKWQPSLPSHSFFRACRKKMEPTKKHLSIYAVLRLQLVDSL